MSKLVVEVCLVEEVKPHPGADRMRIARVKGWETCIRYDPATNKADFAVGDKCVYIPYDAILPLALANGPNVEIPGRLDVAKYCAPVKEDGVLIGYRVRAARLRGYRSFGIIVALNAAQGDDLNWEVGTDVAEHYGITKWEPVEKCQDGDAERSNARFHTYTDIDKYANFPNTIKPETEVVFTEKVHGKNSRYGLVVEDVDGVPTWTWMVGSHGVRRKQYITRTRRFDAVELVERELLPDTNIQMDQIFKGSDGSLWKIEHIHTIEETETETEAKAEDDNRILFRAVQVDENNVPVLFLSDFWKFMTRDVKDLLAFVRDEFPWPEPKYGIILFGEIFGEGVQDMTYGMTGKRDLRAFDIAVNGTYLDYDTKVELCNKFGVTMVPFIYRGPFSVDVMNQYTDGPTTMCDSSKAGKFKGREGIVITPVKEQADSRLGRAILKSVSVDYLARAGGTDEK